MALIKELRGITPTIGDNVFLAETAVIIGDVTIGEDCSIWYGAVLRGDVNTITIGDRVNIQDGVVIHTLYKKSKTKIGDDVSVGHNAVVGSGSIIAANSLVLSGSKLEPNGVYAGVPAKRVKDVTPEQRAEIIEKIAKGYMTYASWYKE